MLDSLRFGDELIAQMDRPRVVGDKLGVYGQIIAELRSPEGLLISRQITHNLITAVGVQGYMGQILATGKPALPNGIKLGTGSTAVTSSGAGAALTTYLAGSNKAFDATYPTVVSGVATYKATFGPGAATSASPITEVALVTDSASNATSTAANTWARALLAGIALKGDEDTLSITWTHTLTAS